MSELKQAVNHPALQQMVEHNPNDLCVVGQGTSSAIWRYIADSMDVADGTNIIKPNNRRTTQPGRWKLCALLVPTASIGHGSLAASSGVLRDPGRKHINVLRLASDVADGETVTIGDFVFEFDDDQDFAADFPVDVSGGVTPAVAGEALADAINEAAAGVLIATVISANEILIENALSSSPQAIACSTDMQGANNGWSHTEMYGGRAPAVRKQSAVSRVPTAQEVALGKLHLVFDFVPTVVFVEVRVTATGVIKAWDGGLTIGLNGLVTLTNAGDTDWATTDTVRVLAIE
jgi:hypothetical protein